MDFGKLASIDKVDFSLKPDPPENADFLASLPPREQQPAIYIGGTGYNQKEWTGKWYPAGTKDGAMLRHYGQQFNTIEHNTTHYRMPDPATVERWREEVPADFRYCPKILQTISHDRQLGLNDPAFIVQFAKAVRPLGDRLGCCFLQLPPYFSIEQLPVLENFLRVFPAYMPLAIEARHESFFQEDTGLFELLEKYKTAAVITDVAGRRDVCHLRLTHIRTLIRFVGNSAQPHGPDKPLVPTDYERVDAWAERLKEWLEGGLREVYFFCHEPGGILAPELAAYAAASFSEKMPRARLRGPKPLEMPGKQTSLF